MGNIRQISLIVAGIFASFAVICSSWLIFQHQFHMTNSSVQTKITGIIWMVPIYSINSFISLLFPQFALCLDILRDCYEAYVLYLFLALMLAYLGSDENEYQLVAYLDAKLDNSESQMTGKQFLRNCKFGTLQYCIIRPLTAFLAIVLDRFHLYDEFDLGWYNGYIYILLLINLSVMYAFFTLAAFYKELKEKLRPFQPVGKFLCIKFVIFFAFWQSVLIYGLVQIGWLRSFDGYSSQSLSTQLQDFLICIEMCILSIAHLFSFSYLPFISSNSVGKKIHLFTQQVSKDLRRSLLTKVTAVSELDSSEIGDERVCCISKEGNDIELSSDFNSVTNGENKGSSSRVHSLLSSHFAADTAIRDFNDAMPVIHIPTHFEVRKGAVILSDPAARIRDLKRQEAKAKQNIV